MSELNIKRTVKQLALIANYENRKAQIENNIPVVPTDVELSEEDKAKQELAEEEAEEALLSLKYELISGIEAELSLSEATDDVGKAYEAILYEALSDDVKRKLAFGRAMMRHDQDVLECNSSVGSEILKSDLVSTETLIEHLCEINMVRQLGVSLGLMPNHVEQIVSNLINRYFKISRS